MVFAVTFFAVFYMRPQARAHVFEQCRRTFDAATRSDDLVMWNVRLALSSRDEQRNGSLSISSSNRMFCPAEPMGCWQCATSRAPWIFCAGDDKLRIRVDAWPP